MPRIRRDNPQATVPLPDLLQCVRRDLARAKQRQRLSMKYDHAMQHVRGLNRQTRWTLVPAPTKPSYEETDVDLANDEEPDFMDLSDVKLGPPPPELPRTIAALRVIKGKRLTACLKAYNLEVPEFKRLKDRRRSLMIFLGVWRLGWVC